MKGVRHGSRRALDESQTGWSLRRVSVARIELPQGRQFYLNLAGWIDGQGCWNLDLQSPELRVFFGDDAMLQG